MKLNLFLLALLMVFYLPSSFCWSATGCDGAGNCYVRSGATGAGTGVNWTNAYTDLPASLTRGATYWVAAGSYPPHSFNDPDSGTGTPVITIKAPTASNHGTSTGWDASFVGQALWQCTSSSTCGATGANGANGGIWNLEQENYIVFDGSYSTPLAPYSDIATSGYGFKLMTNGYGGMGNIGNDCQLCGIVIGGAGALNSPLTSRGTYDHDVTIKYVEVEGNHQSSDNGVADAAFEFTGGSYNLLFSHLYLHHATWDFFLRGNHNNSIAGFGPGNDITIEYTHMDYDYTAQTDDGPHGTACSCSEGLNNFVWRYNVIANMVGTSAGPDTASGASYLTGNGNGGPWYLYGNIWYADDATHCAVGDGMIAIYDFDMTAGDLWLVNNSIVNEGFPFCPTDEATYGIGIGYTMAISGFYDQNNLLYDADISTYTGSDIINNGVTNGGTQGVGVTFSMPVVHSNYAYYASPNTAANDASSNKQVSSSNPFVNLSGNDFRLASDTNPGAALTNTGAYWNGTSEMPNVFNVDMNGNTRSTWSRGALQYAAASASAPSVSLSATAHNFSTGVGTTSAVQSVTLSNAGNASLTIGGITLAGSNPGVFKQTNTCSSSLPAGANCTISITFTPTAVTGYSASLNITDNAAGSPQTVSLTGSGTASLDFAVSASPSSQTVQPGAVATYTISVQPTNMTFNQPVFLSVAGLPGGAMGSFSLSQVTPGSSSGTSILTVHTNNIAQTQFENISRNDIWPFTTPVLALILVFPYLSKRRLWMRRLVGVAAGLVLLGAASTPLGCCSQFREETQTFTLTITGVSGSDSHSTTVKLTVK